MVSDDLEALNYSAPGSVLAIVFVVGWDLSVPNVVFEQGTGVRHTSISRGRVVQEVCAQIYDALFYNAALTLSILQKLGVATEIFNFWFQMLQQVKKSGARVNFKRSCK